MANDIALDIQLKVEEQCKDVEISVSNRRKFMVMTIEKSMTPHDEYPGPYSVYPRFYMPQVLETKEKLMADNVSVEPIPVYEVSNPAGGKTVTIGAL